MSSKKILITGSAGFIGGHIIKYLIYNTKNYNIVSIDKVTTPKTLNKIYQNTRHTFYLADIIDENIIDRIFQKERPDIILHLAATKDIINQNQMILDNISGTQSLIKMAQRYNVGRFIYMSSDCVMGELSDYPKPSSVYAVSKLTGEMLVEQSGLNYNILRPCNIFGPWQLPTSFISKTIYSIINNQKMTIYNKGEETREWMYVSDLCEALRLILDKGIENKLYDISTSAEFSNLELFQQVANGVGKGYELIEFVPDLKHDKWRKANDLYMMKDLGWTSQFKFKHGLAETVQWYKNNVWFFK